MRGAGGPAAVAPAPRPLAATPLSVGDAATAREDPVWPLAALGLRSFEDAPASAAGGLVQRKWTAPLNDGEADPERPAARSPLASSSSGVLCASVSAAAMARLVRAPLEPLEGDFSPADSPALRFLMKVVGAVPATRSRLLNGVHVLLVFLLAGLAPAPWIALYVHRGKPFHIPAAALGGGVLFFMFTFSIWYYRSSPHGCNVVTLAIRLLRTRRREAARRTYSLFLIIFFVGLGISQLLIVCWWLFSTGGSFRDPTWLPACVVSIATVSVLDVGSGVTMLSFALQTSLFVSCYDDISEEVAAADAEEGGIVRALARFPAVAELVASTEAAWGPFVAFVTGLAGMAFAYMAYVFYDAEQDFVILAYAVAMASVSAMFLVSAARVTSAAAGVRDAAGRFLMPGGPDPAGEAGRRESGPAERAAVRFLRYFGSREHGFRVLGVLVTKSLLSRALYLLLSAAGLLLRLALNRSL